MDDRAYAASGNTRAGISDLDGTGEPLPIDLLVLRIVELDPRSVLDLRRTPPSIRTHWPDAASDRIVLTGKRYRHILERHPELTENERRLVQSVLDPDCLYATRKDARMAIPYRRFEDGSRLRISLWISDRPPLKNSIHSARYAHEREIQNAIERHRELWRRG